MTGIAETYHNKKDVVFISPRVKEVRQVAHLMQCSICHELLLCFYCRCPVLGVLGRDNLDRNMLPVAYQIRLPDAPEGSCTELFVNVVPLGLAGASSSRCDNLPSDYFMGLRRARTGCRIVR